MHIGTFHVKEEGHPGTLDSAIEKLPYLKELGINAIEVMPIMEFAGDFSWGYNPSHPFAIESIYGGPDAFKRFVKAAHEHGIAVISDVVYNHFGPSDLDLWRFDGWSENDKGGIYFYNDRRSSTPWGETRPDYGRGEVRHYLCDNALMWFEEYHVDGLRWDAITYIKNILGSDSSPANEIPDGWSLMQWINHELHQRFPGKISIAEDMKVNAWVTQSTGAGGAGFNAQWDSEFVNPVRQSIIARDDGLRDVDAVSERSDINTIKMSFVGLFLLNHTMRFPMVEPACRRRSGREEWIAGFRRNAPHWVLPLFSLHQVSRCYFKVKSCWKIAGSRIKSRSIGLEWRMKAVSSRCIGI